MTDLEAELKALIIETLDLEDIDVADIETDQPLFGDGLGLDSIDALELGLALSKRYGVKLNAEDESTRAHFASVGKLAEFVNSQHG